MCNLYTERKSAAEVAAQQMPQASMESDPMIADLIFMPRTLLIDYFDPLA